MDSRRRYALLLVAAVAGCAESQESTDARQFVARVDGVETFIGVVLDHTDVFGYACDGTPAGTTISSWLVGTVDGDTVHASNPAGADLTGQLGGDTLEGTFTSSQGDAHPFTASDAIEASGLYFGERGHDTEEIWGGWIVITSEQRGAVVDRTTGDIVGSPSIDPAAPSVDVDGAPLEYDEVEEPLGESLDDVPPG